VGRALQGPRRADEADLVGERGTEQRGPQQRGPAVLVELAALGEREVRLEELLGTQRGTGLLDRHRVRLAVVGEAVGHSGGDRDRLARSEPLGIVERRPDPSDGRAKLICLTGAGWEAMRTARRIIAEIEADYARLVGPERFEAAAVTLDELLHGLAAPLPGPDAGGRP